MHTFFPRPLKIPIAVPIYTFDRFYFYPAWNDLCTIILHSTTVLYDFYRGAIVWGVTECTMAPLVLSDSYIGLP